MKLEVELTGELLRRYEGAIQEAVEQGCQDEVRRLVRGALGEELRRACTEAVTGIVGELLDGEFQPTDQWGDPQGSPTTVRRMLARNAQGALSLKVNKDTGSPAKSHSYDTCTLLEWHVKNTQNKLFHDLLQELKKPDLEKLARVAK